MQYTDNYSLRLPQGGEKVKRDDINYNTNAVDGIMADNRKISLQMYDENSTYDAGEIRGHESSGRIKAYKCNTDNTTGVWDSTKWDETDLATEIELAASSGGTNVVANPSGTATGNLTKLQVGEDIYAIQGGGGGLPYAEMTQAEYDQITPAEDTAYFITDTNGTEDTFQPVIYSTDEREIGVWTDGKPLYQKTFYKLNTQSTFSDFVKFADMDNPETVISILWNAKRAVGNNSYLLYTGDGSSWTEVGASGSGSYIEGYGIFFRVSDSGELQYRIGQYGASITDIWATVQYTKSTDTAGSGTWTPQGVPAIHFSEDEHIVGTWIDGSTIYGKTITFTPTLGNRTTYNHGIPNIDKMIMWTGGPTNTAMSAIWGQSAWNDSWGASISLVTATVIEYQVGASWGNDMRITLNLFYTKTASNNNS